MHIQRKVVSQLRASYLLHIGYRDPRATWLHLLDPHSLLWHANLPERCHRTDASLTPRVGQCPSRTCLVLQSRERVKSWGLGLRITQRVSRRKDTCVRTGSRSVSPQSALDLEHPNKVQRARAVVFVWLSSTLRLTTQGRLITKVPYLIASQCVTSCVLAPRP